MNIVVYTLAYNEEFFIQFFLRHYKQITDNIVIYDNGCTDRTIEIARSEGCEIRPFETGNQIRDDLMTELKNNCWKECRGKDVDWAFIVDIDEIVYHPNLINILERATEDEQSLIIPAGYQMISDKLPLEEDKQIYELIDRGWPSKGFSKSCMLDPDLITEIDYYPGCHNARPKGEVKIKKDGKLLHYSRLSIDNYLQKCKARANRLSDINKKNNWGHHYQKSDQSIIVEYKQDLKRARRVI